LKKHFTNHLYLFLAFYPLLFFVLHNTVAVAQLDEKRFTRYTMQAGMCDNSVTALAQDDKGFIWIATPNGLNRFDGDEFSKPAINNGVIDEVLKLSINNTELLLTTRKGIQSLNVQNEQLTTYAVAASEPGSIYINDASDALATQQGEILMCTQTGFYSFSKNNLLNFRYDRYKASKHEYLAGSYGRNILPLSGNLFIHFSRKEGMSIFDSQLKRYASVETYRHQFPNLAAMNGQLFPLTASIGKYKMVLYNKKTADLYFYDAATDRLQPCHAPAFLKNVVGWRMNWYAINDTTAIVTSQKSGVYICRFNLTTGVVEASPTCYFQDFFCTSILKDIEGRLWIGTETGLLKQNLCENPVQSFDIRSMLSNNSKDNMEITAFHRHNNELYVGTYGKEGIYILNARSFILKQKVSFSALDPKCNQVWHILPIAKDTLWFATQNGLVWLCCSNKHFGYVTLPATIQPYISGKPVSIAFRDSHQLLWLQGAWGTGVIQYDPYTKRIRIFQTSDRENYLPVKSPNHITEDKESNIWLASRGLTRWNRQTGRFDTLMENYTGLNSNNPHIISLSHNRRQEIVFSNVHNGVVFFDPASRSFRELTTAQGLPENTVLVVLGAGNDHVWIASRNYLIAWNQQTQKLISYSFSDGIPQEGGVPTVLYHDTVGKRIFIGYSNNHIARVTDSITHTAAQSIPFFIDAISTTRGTNMLYPSSEVTLPYYDNDIQIHITAINFNDAQNNRFCYRTDSNASWIPLKKQNIINFYNLATGTYPLPFTGIIMNYM
jgi:ligand-binding sensor domain-containing protein